MNSPNTRRRPCRATPLARALACALACAWLAGCCAALAVACAPPSRAQESPSGGAQAESKEPLLSDVYGRVVFEGTDRPVRRGRVILLRADGSGPPDHGALTDALGQFVIRDVPAGTYYAAADAPGVVSPISLVPLSRLRGSIDMTAISKQFQEVVVDGKRDPEVTVQARRGAAVSGRVTYPDGEPAAGLVVQVMRREDGQVVKFLTSINPLDLARLTTDDRGRYRVSGLPPGEYVVAVSEPAEHGEESRRGRHRDMESSVMETLSGRHLLTTYHPSATSVEEAAAFKLAAGDEREGTDITIADRDLRTLNGLVRGARDKRPLRGARVTITRRGEDLSEMPGSSEFASRVTTDVDGRWSLRQIPAGLYTLTVTPSEEHEGVYGTPPGAGEGEAAAAGVRRALKRYAPRRLDLDVSAGADEIVIEMPEGGRVKGTALVEGGGPPPDYMGVAAAAAADARPHERDADGLPSARVEGGAFVLDGLAAGKFMLHASARSYGENPPSFYVRSMTWRGRDLLREPLEVGEGAEVEGVQVVFAAGAATLTVRVANSAGAAGVPAAGVFVYLMEAAGAASPARAHGEACVTGGDGTCEMKAAPGDYLVVTVPRAGAELNFAEEVARRAAGAARVTLHAGEQKSVAVVWPGK